MDHKQTKDNNSSFYGLGYPDKKRETLFLKKNNWSGANKRGRGDVLSNDPHRKYGISQRDKIRGFLSAKHFQTDEYQFSWGDKKYSEFGHFYYTNGITLGKGASGSMIVDDKEKLLGVRAMEGEYSLFTPIRAEKIESGEIRTPEYDLISGTENQKSSYKQHVEEHLLQHGKKTWLSSLKDWTYPSRTQNS